MGVYSVLRKKGDKLYWANDAGMAEIEFLFSDVTYREKFKKDLSLYIFSEERPEIRCQFINWTSAANLLEGDPSRGYEPNIGLIWNFKKGIIYVSSEEFLEETRDKFRNIWIL